MNTINQTDVIKQTITSKRFSTEIIVPVMARLKIEDAFEKNPSPYGPPIFVLVYKFESKMSDGDFVYKFAGCQIR